MEDTIVAISTAMGVGAISIIRLSGKEAINITDKIFNKDLTKVDSHTINYGHIIYNDEIIDEVLVNIMKSPKSFTTEDIIEINCHGGISTTNKILEILLMSGCRLAEPGEFTKRAYLNGRISLLESEAVMDLINSKTEEERKLAINHLTGNIKKTINEIRDKLLKIISHIEVNIDYPEYEDIEQLTNKDIKQPLIEIKKELNIFIKESLSSQLIKDGIDTVIIGKPNVGKSSLLNKLLEEEKAIVTDIAGTTRDIVEGNILINGIKLNLIDTAGIRKTNNIIEKIGVEKSKGLIDEAKLLLLVLNGSEKLTKEDKELLEKTEDKTRIIIVNKSDKEQVINEDIKKYKNVIYTSMLNNSGIKEIKEKIIELFNIEEITTKDLNFLSNSRQIALAKESESLIEEIIAKVDSEEYIDLLEIDIKTAWEKLGQIIGQTYEEELIDRLFSDFCLGK